MGSIVDDIMDDVDIEIKPNKSKVIIKWILRVSLTLIALAFLLGQVNTRFFHRIDDFETDIKKNEKEIVTLKKNIDARFDKVYNDGTVIFNEYQQHHNDRFDLFIDYHDADKKLLKSMLDLKCDDETQKIIKYIEKAKVEPVPPLK